MLTNFLNRKEEPNSGANDALQDNRPEVLRQFDDFNTADTANNGIMGGILEEQLRESADRDAFDRYRAGEREQPSTPREREPKQQRNFDDYYAPLNTSIQTLQEQHKRETAALREQVSRMEQMVRNGYQQQQQSQEPQYDPNEYVNFGHLKQTEQRLKQAESYIWQQAMRNEFNRAQIDYLQFKQANPDFALPQEELVDAFNKYANGDPNKVAAINWQGVFSQSHIQRQAPTLRDENERLKKELEQLKRGGSAARPANQRNANPETQPVSPALRSSGRTVATVPGQDNVVNLRSFKQVGNFKGYANDLKRSGYLGQQ